MTVFDEIRKLNAAQIAGVAVLFVLAVLGTLALAGVSLSLSGGRSELNLPGADTPPLEYAYLDSARVNAYLGQAENGLASSEQRTELLKRSVSASLAAGTAAQLGGSVEQQASTATTVTPTAADRFYTFLRLLRGKEKQLEDNRCNSPRERRFWLGEIDDSESEAVIMNQVACVGVGSFVRIHRAQLFLPPFAQALPLAQSANAFFGALPAPRTAFTSPTQSFQLRAGLRGYEQLVGKDPRMPFVAAPYGIPTRVGGIVTFFLPAHYQGLTSEASLLSGSVTIVGKIVYIGQAGGQSYIDYPTISSFGRALIESPKAFLSDLGVCSRTPTAATRAEDAGHRHRPQRTIRRRVIAIGRHPPSAHAHGYVSRRCSSRQLTLKHVKKSVTFRTPVVVVLPLAIYS